MKNILIKLAQELNIDISNVEAAVKLIDEGNTVPFIARYRKEVTGGLSDEQLRNLAERLDYLRNLENRKNEIIRLLEEMGKLSDEIKKGLQKAETLQEAEDIYRPFKPKRRTRASIARERGLEPLAENILSQKMDISDDHIKSFINPEKEVKNADDALAGALDIIAENISDNAEIRKIIRELTYKKGLIRSTGLKGEDNVST